VSPLRTIALLAVAEDAHTGAVMAGLLLVASIPVLALAQLLSGRRRAIGSLQRQFVAGVALAFGLVLIGVGVIALLMLVPANHAVTLAAVLGFAAALAAWSALLVARGVMRDVERVRDGLAAVGEGKRNIEIQTGACDELAELAAEANRMIRRLAEQEAQRGAADRSRRNLVAAVSHDLRTPLTSIRLLSGAIEDELVDEATRRRYLAQMSVHIDALGALIDDLFELSRLEAGDIEWSMTQVELHELVHETVEAMRPQADAKRVVVRSQVPKRLGRTAGNPEQLQRVLFNLIQNAIRHTPEDGSVTVRAQAHPDAFEVEVADTGGGVPDGDRERVFEPFFRGEDDSARNGHGAGLGLTICRAIIEAHGGRISLASTDEGTRVRFSLPAAS
jgi:signal transduction histidine kinase